MARAWQGLPVFSHHASRRKHGQPNGMAARHLCPAVVLLSARHRFPVEPEAGEKFLHAVRVVRDRSFGSRSGKEFSPGLGHRAAGAANPNDGGELHAVEEINGGESLCVEQ